MLRPRRLTDDARRAAGGDLIRLRDGVTHFRADGPAAGRPVVLVHGATVPLWEFDWLAPELHAAGFRTLRFDLFGHGWSDRPAVDYGLELFARQTLELVETIGLATPAAILGHSVGAAVAACAAAMRPEWFERVVLVAPMLDFNASSRWTPAFRLPGVGELLMHFVGIPALVRRRRARYARIGQSHLAERFLEQVSYRGFARALLSMIRRGALGDQTARYSALARLGREVLVVSGKDDAVIPERDIARVCALLGLCRRLEVEGGEHNLLLTHAREVAEVLARFLATPAKMPALVAEL